ncbi:MAG TPA: ArsA family ATPase [Egicoccus sp.]|nr:ArsA family ATPase [Egicoccus sp.]HSK23532.1 ArsA family ATPase [Egicoccus sp.]
MSSQRPVAFVGGKGGVGKTTVSAALARAHAAAGHRTLLVSTDPAHSTGDLLGMVGPGRRSGRPLGGEPVEVADLLEAVEIDPEAVADAYVEAVRRDVHRAVSPEVRATVDRHLDLARRGAGTLESALLDRLGDLLAEAGSRWDRIVVDTAPTGHTLRLLAMPELLAAWIQGLVRQREKAKGVDRMLRNLAGDETPSDDPVIERLHAQRLRLQRLRHVLHDDALFHLVLIPERLPIEETARALESLDAAGLTVGSVVVNRVLPAEADGEFLAQRRAQQADYLAEIERRFAGRDLLRVTQLPRDVADPASLAEVQRQVADLATRS